MPTQLTLDIAQSDDGTPALRAVGEIDLSNVDAFAQALANAISAAGNSKVPVTVDLAGVEYLDSGGINALFHRADYIRVIANPILIPVLTISGLTELVPVEAAS